MRPPRLFFGRRQPGVRNAAPAAGNAAGIRGKHRAVVWRHARVLRGLGKTARARYHGCACARRKIHAGVTTDSTTKKLLSNACRCGRTWPETTMALWVTYDNLSAIVGSEAAFKLAMTSGGIELWVPEALNTTHDLARIMGLHAAKRLCSAYGGSAITVPSRRKRESRAREVRAMLEKGESASHIAVKLGITVRYVRHLAAREKMRDAPCPPMP